MTTTEELTEYLLKLREARKRQDFGCYLTLAGGVLGLLSRLGYRYVMQPSPHWVTDPWLRAYGEELERGMEAFSTENSYGFLDAISEFVRCHYQPLA